MDTSRDTFIGAAALARARAAGPRHRLRTLLVGGAEYVALYGGEAVRVSGEVAGRVRRPRARRLTRGGGPVICV